MNSALFDRVVELVRRLPKAQISLIARLLLGGTAPEATARELPGGTSREELIRLARDWGAADGGTRELGAALAAAARANAVARTEVTLDPVWTGPIPLFPQVRRTDQALVDLIGGARSELLIVSFVTYHVPMVRDALRAALQRGVHITCVLEDTDVNPAVEDQDPTRLLGPEFVDRVTRFVWPIAKREEFGDGYVGKLHAKCAVADDDHLLIGSANITKAALIGNIELGLLVKGGRIPGLVRSHFERLAAEHVLEQVR